MPITDYYVTTDAMGSVMAVLDESGNVLERRSYDAFGEATYMLPDGTVVPDSPTGVDIGFQGQLMDELTGMYQMGFRWYLPALGRWVSRDPIGLEGGVNQVTYALNAAVDEDDPLGLTAESNWDFLLSWMRGGGKSRRFYFEGSVEMDEMKESDGADKLRKTFYERNCNSFDDFSYGTAEAFFHTFWKPWTTEFQVGGFAGAVARRNPDCTVTFTITNVAGTQSFFYHLANNVPDTFLVRIPVSISLPGYSRTLYLKFYFNTPGRSITQVFVWTEKIDRCKCDC